MSTSKAPQQRDEEFLRRNAHAMSMEEIERYSYLAGDGLVHTAAVAYLEAAGNGEDAFPARFFADQPGDVYAQGSLPL